MKDESKEITDSTEAKLKKIHGDVTKITIKGKDKKQYVAYLREPSLAELDATLQHLSSAPVSASVGLFRSIHVGGDAELLNLVEKAGYALAIHKEIQKTIPNYDATSMII
ncbi:hypothetical protein WBG78_28455 [Chryseolinea sp. T2]|uniref:hypothetical protein n=1 Tax=Chryseolinea sp. T2 TaxID=3129255 RepID=UPI003077B95F